MKNKKIWLGIALIFIVLFFFINSDKSFEKQAREAYDSIEQDFINKSPVSEMNEDAIHWVHDQSLESEKKPGGFTEREIGIINNLGTMLFLVSIMNGLEYRDREIEDQYYDVRDTIMQALFEGK